MITNKKKKVMNILKKTLKSRLKKFLFFNLLIKIQIL